MDAHDSSLEFPSDEPGRALFEQYSRRLIGLARAQLDGHGLVCDIGLALATLKAVLGEFAYRNLDDLPEFRGRNTTTEFMARIVFDRIADRVVAGELGPHAAGLTHLRVRLHESHIAWAAYEGTLPRPVGG